MKIASLASGSSANAYVIESQGRYFLIDDGLSFKALQERLATLGLKTGQIEGIFITHNHRDHTSGLEGFHAKHPDVKIYANIATGEAICEYNKVEDALYYFENGCSYTIGPLKVSPFTIPHDAADPVGFIVEADGKTYFHACDVGTSLDFIGSKLALADFATLEFNHDPVMLMASNRPAHIKTRIKGPRGHLCNDDAASLVARFASPKLKTILMGHLSQECNDPRFASATLAEALKSIGREDIKYVTLTQDTPTQFFDA